MLELSNLLTRSKPTTCVLVDRDGTLFSTCGANLSAYEEAFREHGVDFSDGIRSRLTRGLHLTDVVPVELGLTQQDLDALHATKEIVFRKSIAAVDVNVQLLEQIESFSGKRGLVTNASRLSTGLLLERFELGGTFDLVITGDDVSRRKPFPDPYQLALSRLDVDAGLALAVEDSHSGCLSATRAGIEHVRVPHFCSLTNCPCEPFALKDPSGPETDSSK